VALAGAPPEEYKPHIEIRGWNLITHLTITAPYFQIRQPVDILQKGFFLRLPGTAPEGIHHMVAGANLEDPSRYRTRYQVLIGKFIA